MLLRETNSAGILFGLTITNNWDTYLRRTSLTLFPTNGASAFATSFGYDAASRLSGVTNGTVSAGYGYLANSPLISTLTFKQSGTTRMTTTRQHDFLNRLINISSVPSASGQPPVSYAYQYDAANQRRRATLADGSYWAYDYDSLGQVTAGKRYWPEGTPVPGQQFEYGFDDIGNRTQAKFGGDQSGVSLRSASYTNNVLNQITGRDVPAGFDVLGLAHPQATVKVNGSNADYRHEDYFQKALTVSNGSTSVWQSVSVTATNSGASTTWPTGYVLVAKTPEVFVYDGDGNLTSDGRWTYTWDGENRLLSMVSLTNTPTESKRKLEFAYDFQGRRISKRVSCYTNSTWQVTVSNLFVYDGWNLIGELNATNHALIRGYVWGLDLSGSAYGAGGVGGLLCEVPAGSNAQAVAYDGNGDVVALVDATNGSTVSNYAYGPFGECIRASGSAANGNPVQFSTKFQDGESELLYYGYRYYSSSQGRWLNRDPIGEGGGIALYTALHNNPISQLDPLGLTDEPNPKFRDQDWPNSQPKPCRKCRDQDKCKERFLADYKTQRVQGIVAAIRGQKEKHCSEPSYVLACCRGDVSLWNQRGSYDGLSIWWCCDQHDPDTLYHELIHVWNMCSWDDYNNLDCASKLCDEFIAKYYSSTLGRRADRLEVAYRYVKDAFSGRSGNRVCVNEAFKWTREDAKQCLSSHAPSPGWIELK